MRATPHPSSSSQEEETEMTQAKGRNAGAREDHRIVLYALSTCVWCRRTRSFLEEQDVSFDYVYVDLLGDEERESAKAIVRRWNPRVSFPTLVIDDENCVVGFKREEIREAVGLGEA